MRDMHSAPHRLKGWAALTGSVVALALVLAGCSAGGGAKTSAAPSAPGSGKLVFGITADPTQMVPWTSTTTQSGQVLSQIYTPLLSVNEQSEPAAGIASLPVVSDNGLKYTFTLKKNVRFSDGQALTSKDVKYTFDTIMQPSSNASSASFFASVASVEAPTPDQVVVNMKHADASFPAGLTGSSTGIVPDGATASQLQTKPDGAGPYQLVSRTHNVSLTLRANKYFYGGTPGVKTLVFRVIPDAQAMVSSLKTGSVDAAIFDDPVTAKTATAPTLVTKTVGSLQYHVIQLRAASPVLSNVNTRLAIQCAVSRQDVLKTAALGAGDITGPITSPQFRSDPMAQPCPTQDIAKAKEYLKKAGQPDGFTLNLMTSQGLYSDAVDEAQTVQAELAKIGIKVNVETLDSNTYVQKWLSGDFEAAMAMNAGFSDPNTMYARYFTSTGSFNKVAGYKSAALDKLFAEGIATTDLSQRKSIYTQISDQLVDNAVWVWLFTPREFIVLNKNVGNFDARTDANLETLWRATMTGK